MLDVAELCSFADYFVICSGDSNRQTEAIWNGIIDALKQNGVRSHHSEGTSGSGWLLADFGSVVLHVFAPAEREYYQLEKLWDKAVPVVRIQ